MLPGLFFVPRERVYRERCSYFGKFRVCRHKPSVTLQGEFSGESVSVAKVVLLLERSGARSPITVCGDDREGHLAHPGFGVTGGVFAVTPPYHVQDLAPSDGGHQERPVLAEGLLQKSFNSWGGTFAIFE